MSLGWGIRGDYGHEAGAMIPGAMLGLSICLASGREDWWRRAALMGACGAIGWAFGGQMSYARITGYTAGSSLLDVFYGYGCLFVIGGSGVAGRGESDAGGRRGAGRPGRGRRCHVGAAPQVLDLPLPCPHCRVFHRASDGNFAPRTAAGQPGAIFSDNPRKLSIFPNRR